MGVLSVSGGGSVLGGKNSAGWDLFRCASKSHDELGYCRVRDVHGRASTWCTFVVVLASTINSGTVGSCGGVAT